MRTASLLALVLFPAPAAARSLQTEPEVWGLELPVRDVAAAERLYREGFGFDPAFGLRDDHTVMGRLKDAFGDMRIEDMRIPLYLTATRFDDGAQAIFARGRVIDAIRASP